MAHTRFLPQERIEQSANFIGVEELGSSLALEGAADVRVDRRISEPRANGHGEPELLAVGNLVGQHARSGCAQGDLVAVLARLEPRRHAPCDVEHAKVAIWHADVEARATRDLGRVEQDASLEVAAQIGVEHPAQRVVSTALGAALLHEGARRTLFVEPLEIAPLLRVVHDVGRSEVDRIGVHEQAFHIAVHAVAGEELIGALTREAQARLLCHLLACRVKGKARDVCRRLLVSEQELVDVAEEVFRGNRNSLEVAPEIPRSCTGVFFLAGLLVGVCHAETALRRALCQDVGRIDATREEAVGRFALVADVAKAGFHDRLDLVGPVVERLRLVGLERELPVAPEAKPLRIERQVTARLELAHALEERLLARHVREPEIELHELAVELAFEPRLIEQVLDLRAVEQPTVSSLVVEEQLGAQRIAGAEELVFVRVVQGESKLAIDVVAHLLAPTVVRRGDQCPLALVARKPGNLDAQLPCKLDMVANQPCICPDFDHVHILLVSERQPDTRAARIHLLGTTQLRPLLLPDARTARIRQLGVSSRNCTARPNRTFARWSV